MHQSIESAMNQLFEQFDIRIFSTFIGKYMYIRLLIGVDFLEGTSGFFVNKSLSYFMMILHTLWIERWKVKEYYFFKLLKHLLIFFLFWSKLMINYPPKLILTGHVFFCVLLCKAHSPFYEFIFQFLPFIFSWKITLRWLLCVYSAV